MANNKKNKRLLCYHGSSKKDFKPSSKYVRALEEYCHRYKGIDVNSRMNHSILLDYIKDYEQLVEDQRFVQFIFAFGVRDCLGVKEGYTWDTMCALRLGVFLRYHYLPKLEGIDINQGSENYSINTKCLRDIETKRGFINVLARETKSHCECMDDKKKEAKMMPKLIFCNGCMKAVPKEQTSVCECEVISYCSTECQEKDKYVCIGSGLCQGCKQRVRQKKLTKWLINCSDCGSVSYCSKVCQLTHTCKKIKNESFNNAK